ncbi:MAG: hypothetical protein EXR79_01925 [Myxococcales bacterium]|nr:hypothetical protein [Myxococcales bacterium]
MSMPVSRTLTSLVWLATVTGLSVAMPAAATGPDLPAWADEVREVRRTILGATATVRLGLPDAAWTLRGLRESDVEALHRLWLGRVAAGDTHGDTTVPSVAPLPAGVRHVRLLARLPHAIPGLRAQAGAWTELPALVPDPQPVPRRPEEGSRRSGGNRAPVTAPATVIGIGGSGVQVGGLNGKHVYLSPGHGFTWTQALNRWATQRGNTHNLVEDLLNAEAALHYLVPMLWNAGARVVTMRERDLQTAMVLVDDGEDAGAGAAGGGGYSESGAAFKADTNPGFANGKAPYGTDVNPFGGGSYRTVQVSTGAATATATFAPKLPATGRYAVYLGYSAGTNRVPDAHVEIRHAGGSTHLRIDQTRHGQTWNYLGHYAFAAGAGPELASVRLHNDTLAGKGDRYLIADVVRFGGGMGDIARGTGKPPAAGPTSGRPRWEESCRTYAQFTGAPPSVYDGSDSDPNDDVGCRSRLAAWDHEDDEDAIYLSWHTNAPSPARGTSTYVYGPNPVDGTYQFTGTKGSDTFGKLIQKIMVDDIRKLWDPAWKDRGVNTAYFGEINPKHNDEMPAALVEAAFHSTLEDADQLREPRFRHLLARALYKAIAKYFADRDKQPLLLLPEPPQDVALVRSGPGKATLTWKPGPAGGVYGDAALVYLIQTSTDGLGFATVAEGAATSATLSLPAGAQPLFARVVAQNMGGVSFPSAVVGAVEGCAGARRALVVQGFSRLDSGMAPIDDLKAYSLNLVQRLRQVRMNTYDYSTHHVRALANAGLGVDTVERGAVAVGVLDGHDLVDWAAGEQGAADGVVTVAQRGLLTTWLQAGKDRALWLNGAEAVATLDAKADPGGGDWLETWFGARLVADDAGSYALAALPNGGLTAGGLWTFDDGSQHAFDVGAADVLAAKAGGVGVLSYGAAAQAGALAGVRKAVPGGATALVLGVPLEAVYPDAARNALVAALVGLTLPGAPCGGGAGADAGPAGSDGGVTDGGDGQADTLGAGADGQGLDTGTAPVPGDAADARTGTKPDAGAGVFDAVGFGDALPDANQPAAAAVVAPDAGCGCRVAGASARIPSAGALGLALAGFAALFAARRRRQARDANARGAGLGN